VRIRAQIRHQSARWCRAIAGHGGQRGGSRPVYGQAERVVLKRIWLAAKQTCGKRLVAALPVWLRCYEKRYGQLAPALRRGLPRGQCGDHGPIVGPVPCQAWRSRSLRDASGHAFA